ncbi:MAG: S4 domain-containing protein, partial [Patescibacteria group bacterium]
KEIPEDVEVCKSEEDADILEFLVSSGGATSKGDARRKVEQGGVSIDGEKVTDVKYTIEKGNDGKVMKVGKKFFVKIAL